MVPAWLGRPVRVSSSQQIPLDAGHGAEAAALALQHRSLLDVQFEIGMRRQEARLLRPVIADALQLMAEHGAVGVLLGMGSVDAHAAGPDIGTEHVGMEARALLIGEGDHRHVAFRRHSGIAQRRQHLDAADDAERPVEASPGADRVDMRAHDHRRPVLLALQDADDVADRIDPDVEAERSQLADQPISSLLVLIRQRQPPAAALRRRADPRQGRQPREQALAVDPQVGAHLFHSPS